MSIQRKTKRKRWHDQRALKIREKWYSKKKRYCKKFLLEKGEIINRSQEYVAVVPSVFSFSRNPEETIIYLDRLIHRIEKKILRQKFFIDASKVTTVTTEALIYIIAVIYNIKANRTLKYSFRGNLPLNKTAREVFEKSGYLNYFKMKRLMMPDCSEYVQIVSGQKVENAVAVKICDFVNEKYGTDRKFTKVLYSTLIELMSNTSKHAYNNDCKMVRCWYLYAIYSENSVNIAFVDTGEGIPSTVKKKIIEKINPLISDSSFIYAALTEKGRSETGLSNRGHGLQDIYKNAMNGKLKNFFVISGHGSCKYSDEKHDVVKYDYKESIFGTIFRFTICKEAVE